VYDGKLLHETSYPQRAIKHTEVELSANFEGITLTGKIDFYDAKDKIIHETKRSDKVKNVHIWQLKYYLWLFELNGIPEVRGLLEYPQLRQTSEVTLQEVDRSYLQETVRQVRQLLQQENCPARLKAKICKSCSYYELCYIDE
jgi:CRISPR-associated exonuclease Cas4